MAHYPSGPGPLIGTSFQAHHGLTSLTGIAIIHEMTVATQSQRNMKIYGTEKLELDDYIWIGHNRKSSHVRARKGYGGVGLFVKGTTRGLGGVFLPLVMNPLCPLNK